MIVRKMLVGLPAMLVCMVVQVTLAFWGVAYFIRNTTGQKAVRGSVYGLGSLLIVMVAMMLGTIVQIALWGILFMVLGEFTDVYEAVYHSAVNFASLGYGDFIMSTDWKLLGPLEACCGVLMLGMTAAALMAILQQMIKVQIDLNRRD